MRFLHYLMGTIMKLFYATGSSSLFPHIVLHEAGLPFEAIKIDEHTKEISGGGNYRSVNPLALFRHSFSTMGR